MAIKFHDTTSSRRKYPEIGGGYFRQLFQNASKSLKSLMAEVNGSSGGSNFRQQAKSLKSLMAEVNIPYRVLTSAGGGSHHRIQDMGA